jgi:hypothetical protein
MVAPVPGRIIRVAPSIGISYLAELLFVNFRGRADFYPDVFLCRLVKGTLGLADGVYGLGEGHAAGQAIGEGWSRNALWCHFRAAITNLVTSQQQDALPLRGSLFFGRLKGGYLIPRRAPTAIRVSIPESCEPEGYWDDLLKSMRIFLYAVSLFSSQGTDWTRRHLARLAAEVTA